MSIKPAGAARAAGAAAAAAAAAGATGEMSNFSNMEKHGKIGKYCCGYGTQNFETKLKTPQTGIFLNRKTRFFSHQHKKGKTLIIFFFCVPSVAEMMIGAMMMKVIQTLTTCTNMMNIHILKSYIDATLAPNISSMHAY